MSRRSASGQAGRGGACTLQAPFIPGARRQQPVNRLADLAALLRPTVAENFPHRAARGFPPSACGDGGAKLAPPSDLGFCRAVPHNVRHRSRVNGGGKFPAPSLLAAASADGGAKLTPPCDQGFRGVWSS